MSNHGVSLRKKGQHHKGSASSAAKMNKYIGTEAPSLFSHLYVPGEGWVKWADIGEQVLVAHRNWRHRKAMAGTIIQDKLERVEAEIQEAIARQKARKTAWNVFTFRDKKMEKNAKVRFARYKAARTSVLNLPPIDRDLTWNVISRRAAQ